MLASDRGALPASGGQVPGRAANLRLREGHVGPARQRRAQHEPGRGDHGHAGQQGRRQRAHVGVRQLAVLRLLTPRGAPGKRRWPQLGLQKHPRAVRFPGGSLHIRLARQQRHQQQQRRQQWQQQQQWQRQR